MNISDELTFLTKSLLPLSEAQAGGMSHSDMKEFIVAEAEHEEIIQES